ncbi:MAG: hypothetical protein NTZ85_04785, partial [Bacteroidia bacterium]|nr:hypothetical protein [Bacteroidia bacterium]
MKKFFAFFFIIPFCHLLTAQNIDKHAIVGSWIGKISTGAVSLRVVFNLSLVEKDSLTATLDSPDQGAKNIKIGPVTLDGNDIKISALVTALFAFHPFRIESVAWVSGRKDLLFTLFFLMAVL